LEGCETLESHHFLVVVQLEVLVNEFVLGHIKAELSVFEERISQVVVGKEQFFF
jgi:hypothetical protein